MDPRGPRWPETVHQSHSGRDREDYSHSAHRTRDHHFPPPPPPLPDPRQWGRQWPHPDANYRGYGPSPAPRPEYTPSAYKPPEYGYGYDLAQHSRPQSRHSYDYPPYNQREYRESLGYYNQDYYRGQHGHPDNGQWLPSRADHYHERTYERDNSGNSFTEQYRYDQQRESVVHDVSDDKENGQESSYYPGTLASSKTSGMSSSCYELSQYIDGTEQSDPVPLPVHPKSEAEKVPQTSSAPLKYVIPHAVVSFGPAGQLIRITPGFSMQDHPGQLEIHSLEVILGETQEQLEMRNFPGPLTREDLHKVDAIEFAHQRADACMRDNQLQDRSSAALLWNLLILLCRQNGRIVGSDIAELLMADSRSDGSWQSNAPTLIDFSDRPTHEVEHCGGDDLLTGHQTSFNSETPELALQSYTKLLLAGRKKEALESAMNSGLWGHALFLASKMDNRSYTTVLNRFTGQLTASDPLQTLFHLLSGRIPAVATSCGNEKWGDWRPHLAVMLSNETGHAVTQQKATVTMGDSLASRGLLHAAHVCYLMAYVPFRVFTQKAERLVLLGSSHRLPFAEFAQNAAIQCTELFEYSQTLGGKSFCLPYFQVYKFLYASRLLDYGLASQAFHYCEVVGQAVLRQEEPFLTLTGEVIKLAERLRYSEGSGFSGAAADALEEDPDWLKQLRLRHRDLQMGTFGHKKTYQPPGGKEIELVHENSKEPDLEELQSNIQSLEAEFIYYRGPTEEENLMHQGVTQSEDITSWSQASSPPLLMPDYASPVLPVAGIQGFSYHNTDGGEVRTAPRHSLSEALPSAVDGLDSDLGMMGIQVKGTHEEDEHSAWGQRQPAMAQELTTEQPQALTDVQPKQTTKAGWFSGWFKSKPKDVQIDNSEQTSPAKTPSYGLGPPPLSSMGAPALFQSQPPTAGMNPFSRKSGQQLG